MGDLPEVRASDADREHAVEVLRSAAGNGRLTFDELEARLGEAYGARTRAELEALTGDLEPAGDAPPQGSYVVRHGEGGARWLLAILGSSNRTGRWRLAERCNVVNIMGGNDVDIGAEHPSPGGPVLRLNLFSLMGGSDVKLSRAERKELKRRRRHELGP